MRIRQKNIYEYAGIFGISPWTYALTHKTPADAEGPIFGLEAGIGAETNPHGKGWNFGIEGGLVIPIPKDSNTGAFRIDGYGMYKF